jgi:uncharacterized C2H2 Zn-finger protein
MNSLDILIKSVQKKSKGALTIKKERESDDCSESQTSYLQCRICLKHGKIPIFGIMDISEQVSIFGDIALSADDVFPKYLCDFCHNLLEAAILFRQTAKKSNIILQETYQNVDLKTTAENVSHIKIEISEEELVKPVPTIVIHSKPAKAEPGHRCGKTIDEICDDKNHCLTHADQFPYKCSWCPYRGGNISLWRIHMRTHLGEHKFGCGLCPAKFHTKSNFSRHMLTHKEPTMKCKMCDKAYHKKTDLEKHVNASHLGIKSHVCDYCGKGFGYRKAMMKHQLKTHKRKKKSGGRTAACLDTIIKEAASNK